MKHFDTCGRHLCSNLCPLNKSLQSGGPTIRYFNETNVAAMAVATSNAAARENHAMFLGSSKKVRFLKRNECYTYGRSCSYVITPIALHVTYFVLFTIYVDLCTVSKNTKW